VTVMPVAPGAIAELPAFPLSSSASDGPVPGSATEMLSRVALPLSVGDHAPTMSATDSVDPRTTAMR
jgi:hypothetical protein